MISRNGRNLWHIGRVDAVAEEDGDWVRGEYGDVVTYPDANTIFVQGTDCDDDGRWDTFEIPAAGLDALIEALQRVRLDLRRETIIL